MIYDPGNCMPGTAVADVDTMEQIARVMTIDTEANTVTCAHYPYRADGEHVAAYTLRYRHIAAIRGQDPLPCLFHCYGLQ